MRAVWPRARSFSRSLGVVPSSFTSTSRASSSILSSAASVSTVVLICSRSALPSSMDGPPRLAPEAEDEHEARRQESRSKSLESRFDRCHHPLANSVSEDNASTSLARLGAPRSRPRLA